MNQNTNNLDDQFDQVYIDPMAGSKTRSIQYMSFDMYKLVDMYDPETLYIVDIAGETKYFLGNKEVSYLDKDDLRNRYDLSITSSGKYRISSIFFFHKIVTEPEYRSFVEKGFVVINPVVEFNNAREALDALITYNNYGFHKKEQFNVGCIIYEMIHKELTIHEAIMHILTVYNYSGYPDFQRLNQIILSAPMANKGIDEMTMQELRLSRNTIFTKYSDIYDEFLINDFYIKIKDDSEELFKAVNASVIKINKICMQDKDFGLMPNRVDERFLL